MKEYIKVWQNFINFSDRSSRRDYWMFLLVHILISFGLGVVVGLFKLPPMLINLYAIAIIIPSIAVAVRRVHDVNKSGWFILIPFYNLYLMVLPGDKAPNRFGAI